MSVARPRVDAGSNRIEVLLVGLLPATPSGQSVSLRMLLEGLVERGIPHQLIDLAPKRTRSRVDGTFGWGRVWDVLRELPSYVRGLLRGRPTVYLLIGQSTVGFLRDACFIWLAWLLDRRIVVHLKGGNYDRFYERQPRWLQRAIRVTLERTDTIIVLSERLKGCFVPIIGDSVPMRVVANGLPIEGTAAFTPLQLDGDEPLRILYLSNLIESKGYWEVLEACRRLSERGVEFRCRFCGEFRASRDDRRFDTPAAARDAFLARIDDLGLGERVRWMGIVRGDEKREMLRWAHCMVLPTRYVNEGQPVSLIEGMAFGAVLIGTDYRAVPDLIEDGVNGFLLEEASGAELADRLRWLASRPGAIERMSAASLDLFRRRFSRERHLDSLLRVLTDGGVAPER